MRMRFWIGTIVWFGSILLLAGLSRAGETHWEMTPSPYKATIYLPEQPASWEEKAADLLRESWLKLTGIEAVVKWGGYPRLARTAVPYPETEALFFGWEFSIGNTRFNQRWLPSAANGDSETFRYRSRGFLVGIAGNTPLATWLGVTRFLQDELGIYWLYPGDSGWAMSKPAPTQGVYGIRHGTPGYLSRTMFGMRGHGIKEWMERNGVFQRFSFHHNLYNIFNEATYEQHPEFFPLVRGERIRPNNSLGGANAQIAFGNDKAAEYAADRAIDYFEKYPNQISFSLGINDTKIFNEGEEDQKWIDPNKTFRGVPDYSNLIYRFMNLAAERLSERYPDRYLGCLAYYVAENVPDFPVHPQVIPYLTADRNLYWDADFRKEDEDLQRRWSQSGVKYWGTYDYFYGNPYDHIRDYHDILPITSVGAWQRGARGATAELNPRWGINLPVPWVLAQLWWKPDQDVEALYKRFYQLAFGPGAELMQAFFAHGEQVWARQQGRTYWLRNYYNSIQWSWWRSEDFAVLNKLLDQAATLIPKDSPYWIRLKLVERDFRQLEAGWRYLSVVKDGIEHARIPSEQELVEILNDLRWIRAEVPAQDMSGFPEGLPQWDGLALVNRYMQRRPEYAWISKLLQTHPPRLTERQKQLLLEWDQMLPAEIWRPWLAVYSSLEAGDAGKLVQTDESWQGWKKPGSHPDVERNSVASGEEIWKVSGSLETRIFRDWSVEEKHVYRIQVPVKASITEGSRVDVQVYFMDENKQRLAGEAGRAKIYSLPPTKDMLSTTIDYLVQAPVKARFMRVQQVAAEQADGDWVEFGPLQVFGW